MSLALLLLPACYCCRRYCSRTVTTSAATAASTSTSPRVSACLTDCEQAEGREQDLQQRLAVAELEVRKLAAALAARLQRAADAQMRLQALLP